MTKLAKDCTLRLTTTKLYFILSERVVTGGVSIWCELAQVTRIRTASLNSGPRYCGELIGSAPKSHYIAQRCSRIRRTNC